MAEAGRTGPAAASGAGGEDGEDQGHLLGFSARARVAGGTLGSVEVTQTTMTLLFQLALFEQAEVVSSGLWRELGEDREVCPT